MGETRIMPRVRDNDWISLRKALNVLSVSAIGRESSPTYRGLTLTGLTPVRLIASDTDKSLISSDLVNWVAGTTNRVSVTDDTDGTITLSGPQDIHIGASPTFENLTLAGLTATRLVETNADKKLVSSASDITAAELEQLSDGSETALHIHDARYYTETELGSVSGWSSGASLIGISSFGSPSVNDVQGFLDNTGSTGFFEGGEITDAGSGTINIAAGKGFIRATDNDNASLLSFEFGPFTSVAVTANATEYVYVSYNGGSPIQVLSNSEFDENNTKIQIGVATNEAGTIESVFNLGVRLEESLGAAGRFLRHFHGPVRNTRKGGLIFGETGTRNLTLSVGEILWGRTHYTITARTGGETFDIYYRDSPSGFIKGTGTQWPNEQYDDGSGTLATLTGASKWAVLWLYIEPDNHIVVVYGRQQHNTMASAETESLPDTLPPRLQETALQVARIIFRKSAATGSFSSSFATIFQSLGITDHVDLANIGTNTHAEIDTHISSDGSDHTFLDQSVISGAAPTFTADNLSDGGGNAIITTTQETNFEAAFSHVSASGSSHSDVVTNSAKTTNATHTGEVTGSGTLTAQPTMITGKAAATVASGDLVLMSDIDDTNILKKVTAQSIADLGGGGDNDKVGIDAGATADFIGSTSSDGVLRTDASLDYADGGDFVTLSLDSTLKSNYDAAFTHVSADGSSHADVAANTSSAHAESHSVASHNDTTATGAELETLTDGSTTTLHTHAIGFVDGGDPNGWDLREGDGFTDLSSVGDGNDVWYEFDLNAIVGVPTNAKAVLMRIQVKDNLIGGYVTLRDSANSNSINGSSLISLVANAEIGGDFVTPITDGKIDIRGTNPKFSEWTFIKIVVKGWWL